MPFKTAHCLSSAKHLSRAFPHPISRTTTGRVYTAGGHIQNAAAFFLRWDVCALCVAASYSSLYITFHSCVDIAYMSKNMWY